MVRKTTLFRKIFTRLLFIGVFSIFAVAVVGSILLFVSYRKSATTLEQTLLAQKRAETDRYIKQVFDYFGIYVGYEQNTAIPYDQQFPLLKALLGASPNVLDVSIVNVLPSSGSAFGFESSRAVKGKTDEGQARFRGDDTGFKLAQKDEPFVGPVQWQKGQPVIKLARPIHNKTNVIIGVLMGELDLSPLQQIFQVSALNDSPFVFLLDEQSRVMASSLNANLLGKDVSFAESRDAFSGGVLTSSSLSSSYVLASSLQASSVPWRLVSEWPATSAFAPLIALLREILLIAVLMVVAIVFLAVSQSREIVRPVKVLQEAVLRIGKGDFRQKVSIKTRDEIEALGEALNVMEEDLARLQEVRSAEIKAQSFAQAVEKEEELSKSKEVLLSTASHQFRTPISALNWSLELLANMDLDKDAAELIKGVSEHAKNLSALTSDLLNASAFGAGYQALLSEETIKLGSIIKEVYAGFADRIKKKSLNVDFAVLNEDIAIRGDKRALRIMFENVLANAIDYTQNAGGIKLELSRKDNEIIFTVKDGGIGIPKQQQQMVFSPFFRAANAISQKNVGTGLGLFIANNVARGHRGYISFVSQEGQGSEFTVVLPAAE